MTMGSPLSSPPIWQVGALCRAVADALESSFNPVAVRGELTGLSRAASGHLYFSLKDSQGQIRCAMFRRAATLLNFPPQDGELVELRGRVTVYEPRGDLQLIVESMSRAGHGALFEQYMRLKQRLQDEGLFDASRKRALPLFPRGIGVVTSLDAAALHDVVAALRRRLPHVPVVLSAASVQGANAAGELVHALQELFDRVTVDSLSPTADAGKTRMPIDVILLVRGGGSIEDLWPFNDERLARALARSPVPVISGVGHETDFTIADFVADVRATTPTAAAELVAAPMEAWLGALESTAARIGEAMHRAIEGRSQRLDRALARLGRPSGLAAQQRLSLARLEHSCRYAVLSRLQADRAQLLGLARALPDRVQQRLERSANQVASSAARLRLLDPRLVLQRGYAWLADENGRAIVSAIQPVAGQRLTATLVDGEVDLRVLAQRPD